jgi:hypothetical protein
MIIIMMDAVCARLAKRLPPGVALQINFGKHMLLALALHCKCHAVVAVLFEGLLFFRFVDRVLMCWSKACVWLMTPQLPAQ